MAGIYEVDLTGKLQEIGDSIFIAESEKTPITRLLRRGKKPVAMLCDWIAQKYPDRAFTGTLDGVDMTSFNKSTRVMIEGYAMLMRTEGWLVTVLAQLVRTAGVKNESAKQAADDAIILAQMMEKQILSNLDTRVESGSDTYRSRSMYSWLNPSAQSVKPVDATLRPNVLNTYTGAYGSFTPASLTIMLNSMAGEKKGPVNLTAPMGLSLKGQMSSWPQLTSASTNTQKSVSSFNIDASEKKLINAVDTFVFDAGTVDAVPSFYLMCTESTGAVSAYSPLSGLFLDLTMWELCFLLNPSTFEGVDAGGGPRGWHAAAYILKCLNGQGQGYVLTNS